jgi:hypothetical protein
MRIVLALLFCLIGVAFLYVGIKVLVGFSKRWILLPYWHYPPTKSAILAAHRTGYFRGERLDCPTWGIATALILSAGGVLSIEICILIVLLPFLSSSQVLWGMRSIFATFLFVLVTPVGRRWFKSHWAYWLEENYGGKLDILIADVRRDPEAWEKRVATREGLEEWAREVAGEPLSEGGAYKITQATGRRRITRLDEDERERAKKSVYSAVKSFNPGEQFTILDLEHICQGIGRGTILQVLVQLRTQGLVECTGRGRSARWRRV